MIRIPLTKIGSPEAFAKAVNDHVVALAKHMMGPAGRPAPRASELIESIICRVPQEGPVDKRGPDTFQVMAYEVYDDRPEPVEVRLEKAAAAMRLKKFRESINTN